jgi:hypothetical protein
MVASFEYKMEKFQKYRLPIICNILKYNVLHHF